MLSPNTAQRGRSVWDRVDRSTFEHALDSLHHTKFIPEPQVLQETDWPEPRGTQLLPFTIEKQLSDDIAFISAYEYGVQYVTVATIEADKQGLLVRLAANEGVCNVVMEELTRLFSVLEKCAEKALSREQCAEDALDVIVRLNRNKILGRLASRHFQRPPHEKGPPRSPLSERFRAYLSSSKRRQYTDIQELQLQGDAFHTAFLRVEDSEADIASVKHAVKDAFRLTVDGFSLPTRLEKAELPSNMDTRVIREINKIANYWRICYSLAHLSRSYRTLFAQIKVGSIEPFAPSVRPGSSKTRHIHAEVQVLTYYEIRGEIPIWPRAIGASKEACFLCNSFIRAHGYFCISKAHRQVYPQWTIPDLAQYSMEALNRLQRALLIVNRDVASVLKQARRKRSFRPFPPQSSTNLHRIILPTPSVTTIRSSTEVASQTTIPCPTAAQTNELLAFNQLSLCDGSLSTPPTDAPPSCRSPNSTNEKPEEQVPNFNGAHLRSPGFEIQTQRVEAEDLDCNLPNWLGLYAYAESSPRCIAGNFSRRSITLESSTDNVVKRKRIDHHLDLSKLAPGEEIVLSPVLNCNEDVSLGTVMSVVLTYPRMNSITMTCLWYRDNEPSGEMPDVRLAATAAKEIDGKCNAQHLVERESRVVMA